ncbi:MAG: hypothetical protein AAF414_09390 [Pseudomonadota bacterium]
MPKFGGFLPSRIVRTSAIVAAGSFLAISTMTPSAAVGQDECAHPDILSTFGEVAYIDHSDEGAGPGDNRVLIHHLTDEDGDDVGFAHVLSTVMHSPESGESGETHIHLEGTVHLDDGVLHWSDVQTLFDPTDTSRTAEETFEAVVTGGTGAFRHASGVIHGEPLGDGAFSISFDISCNG